MDTTEVLKTLQGRLNGSGKVENGGDTVTYTTGEYSLVIQVPLMHGRQTTITEPHIDIYVTDELARTHPDVVPDALRRQFFSIDMTAEYPSLEHLAGALPYTEPTLNYAHTLTPNGDMRHIGTITGKLFYPWAKHQLKPEEWTGAVADDVATLVGYTENRFHNAYLLTQ